MSGERKLDTDGNWLLMADGSVAVCDECCVCCDYYNFHFVYTGSEDPCCIWDEWGTIGYGIDVCVDGTYPIVWDGDGVSIIGYLTVSSGICTLYAEHNGSCGTPPYEPHPYEAEIDCCEAGCLPGGTYLLPYLPGFLESPTCVSPMEVTIVPACCKCAGKCWKFTLQAVTPYAGPCLDCQQWNDPVEYDAGIAMYPDCLTNCTEDDFGFPVSFCYDGTNVYLRASLEVDNTGDCGPFYIHYSRATPLPLTAEGCPQDGTYLLELDPSHDGEPCDIPEINVTIEQISCCDLITDEPNYFLSFDYEYHSYYSIDNDAVDCDGNPNGENQCNVVDSATDIELFAGGGSNLWTNYSDWNPTIDCGAYDGLINLACIGGGEWELSIALIATATTIKSGGLTPVGTYPDISICYNDGSLSYRLDITNIVVTA